MTLPAPATPEPPLLRHDADGIARLTLNRPAQFNALSEALLAELETTLADIAADASVRVVVLGAAGRAFSAGHDLRELRAQEDAACHSALFARCSRMMLGLQRMPQPVIAAVHGIATAAGCQLVAMCDLALAAASARFAVSGVNLGLFCSTPGVALARNVPRKKALELLLTGDFIDAQAAERIGLVNRVVPDESLEAECLALAQKIAAKPAAAIAIGKLGFYRQIEMPIAEAYALTAERMACNLMAPEAREGIDAFLEKRRPNWSSD